ncbi:MAG: hypothetical protein Q9215_007199 [Flavoplaca cf. flavocitrina]
MAGTQTATTANPLDEVWGAVANAANEPVTVLITETASANFSIDGTNSAAAPTFPPSSVTSPGRTKIAVGISVPVGFLLICLSLALAFRRFRKHKRGKTKRSNDETPGTAKEEDQAPYFQQKGELDAHGNSKFELGAEQRQYELEGDTDIHEMPTNADVEELGGRGRVQLRGAEHSRELKA